MTPQNRTLDREEIIALAACPTCCAFRGEPCTFIRAEDPQGRRMYARQSHPARTLIAKRKTEERATALKTLASQIRL